MDEKRRFNRFPVYCPIEYKTEGDNFMDPAITLNMSEGGALISTRRFVDATKNVVIKILLARKDFTIRSRTVHIQQALENEPYEMGVEFLEKTEEFIKKFNEELSAIEMYQKKCCARKGREMPLAEASIGWYNKFERWI